MPRYDLTKKKTSIKTKKSGYSTTIYDDVPKLNTDIYVITQEGDRLDNLANEYYGDPNLWWFIARVNHLKTMNVSRGKRLRIPTSLNTAKGS